MSNELVREHIDALFSARRAEIVRAKAAGLHGADRERVVLESFEEGLREIGFQHVLRFRFRSRGADRTSHHLIHCSRHPTAEAKMKEVMFRHSAKSLDGVPLFEIPPEDCRQGSLFDQPLPPIDLAGELLRCFAGRIVTLQGIMARHSTGTPFVERNYRAALEYLLDQGAITCEPPLRFRDGKRVWPKSARIAFSAK